MLNILTCIDLKYGGIVYAEIMRVTCIKCYTQQSITRTKLNDSVHTCVLTYLNNSHKDWWQMSNDSEHRKYIVNCTF